MSALSSFGRMWWWAVLASALVLGAAAASAQDGPPTLDGYIPYVDSATDDGDGEIRISWSFHVLDGWEVATTNHPDEILVEWQAEERGNSTYLSDSTSTNPANDLVVDTGIGSIASLAEETFTVTMMARYGSKWMYGLPEEGVSVTVQGGGSASAQQ